MEWKFYVYFIASKSGVLYIGITNNLEERVRQHKTSFNIDSFAAKYKCRKLVYYEETQYILNAIAREKQLKRWSRKKKVNLINSLNPDWRDLLDDWYD